MTDTTWPVEAFLPSGANWELRKEWFERRGIIRRRPVLCQLWVDADHDRWAIKATHAKGRKVTIHRGEGVDSVYVKEGNALVSLGRA